MRQNPVLSTDPYKGKIIYVLVLTVLVQFLYPVSITDSAPIQIGFQIFYMAPFLAGIYLVSENRSLRAILATTAVAWLIVGTIFAFYPDMLWVVFLSYIIIIFFQAVLTAVLLQYIFQARLVNRDVLLAACTVYLLLGAIFVPIYGFIETATYFPEQTTHAFIDGVNSEIEGAFPWQTLVYYSYATLSTLGYGDVLPATPWARSAATLEAVIGVLYTAIIVARLVGLYASNENSEKVQMPQSQK